jgi:hypothetical protein
MTQQVFNTVKIWIVNRTEDPPKQLNALNLMEGVKVPYLPIVYAAHLFLQAEYPNRGGSLAYDSRFNKFGEVNRGKNLPRG